MAPIHGVEPLPVRADGLKPGHFFVGVAAAFPETEPVIVEYAVEGTEIVRRFRSDEKRGFDLCPSLRTEGLADKPRVLNLTVRRGEATIRFRTPYDGSSCRASRSDGDSQIKLVPMIVRRQEEVSSPGTQGNREVPSSVGTDVPAPAVPPAGHPALGEDSAAKILEATPSPVPVPSPVAPTPGPALSARERGLVPSNFDGLEVFRDMDRKTKTFEYRFVLRFKKPVNLDGIESCVILSAKAVRGAPRELLLKGDTELIDVPEDPLRALTVSFSVSEALALESVGINHLVYLRLSVGNLEGAVFEGRAGVRAGRQQ